MRHGETDWNKARRLQGQVDIPLNEYGIHLAEITSQALSHIKFDRIYSSPLIRAYETANIMSKYHNLPVITDSRLLELSFGESEGVSLDYINSHPDSNLYDFIHNPEKYLPPSGGETLESLYDRCGEFLNKVIFPLENECESILIVAHGALIRGMIYHMNHRDTSKFWSMVHKNCSVTISEYKDHKFSLLEEAKIYYSEDTPANW